MQYGKDEAPKGPEVGPRKLWVAPLVQADGFSGFGLFSDNRPDHPLGFDSVQEALDYAEWLKLVHGFDGEVEVRVG